MSACTTSGDNASCDVTMIMAPKWDWREPAASTAYVCQYLRSLGCRVQYLDYNIRLYDLSKRLGFGRLWTDDAYHQAWLHGGLRFLSAFLDVEEVRGGIVGISFTATNRELSLWLAQRIRERFPRKKIVFGGYALYFESDLRGIPPGLADVIVKGEGEYALRDLLAQDFRDLESIPGIYLPRDQGWHLTAERPLIPDLNEIPWPTFEEVDLSRYGVPDLPLMASRGCIGRCIFCNDRIRAPRYRTRSAVSQVDELEYLKGRYDTDFFIYNEPLMNGNLSVMEAKADEIQRRGLRVKYGGNLMVRPQMSRELLQKLRASGLTVAIVGVESGSSTTLERMGKYHNREAAAEFIRNCHDAGMRVEVNLIVGFPTETEAHFDETVRFVAENRDAIDCVVSVATFNVVYSDLFEQRDAFGIVMDENAPPHTWRTKDGSNTYDVRVKRLERLLQAVRDAGIATERTDTAIEQASPNIGREFLNAYRRYWRSHDGLTAEERADAKAREARMRRELLRASAIDWCTRLGILDRAVWFNRKLRRR